MKKILSIALIATLTVAFSAGCGATPGHDAKLSNDALYIGTHDNEAVISGIKKAADSTGWEITEFKSNEVIAEKTDDGETIATIIKIYDGYVEFENDEASDLLDALDDEMKKEGSDLH